MRVAVLSDIHGNLMALEAVMADLRETSPDLVLQAGDVADGCSSPAEVVDLIRASGWEGVLGNTDEMLTRPESLHEFAERSPSMKNLLGAIEEIAAATREALGDERLAWLAAQPRRLEHDTMAIVHATIDSLWRAPASGADDAELATAYRPLGKPIVVYGHIHTPFVRSLAGMTVVNTGSVGLPYDGDPRASYVLFDGSVPTIRRVEYPVETEIALRNASGIPHAAWTENMLRSAGPTYRDLRNGSVSMRPEP